jgi:hypothetical protein
MTTEQVKTSTTRGDQDDVLDRIDAATSSTGDIAADSLEARLRLVLPGHTFFKKESGVPEQIQRFLASVGGELVGAPKTNEMLAAIWTTPTGVWLVKALECSKAEGRYHVVIDGPDTDLDRDDLSPQQALDLLAAVGAISPV